MQFRNDHMVQNPPCWRASSWLFLHWDIKTKRSEPVKLDLSMFWCPSAGIIMSLSSSMADFVPCDRLLQKAYCCLVCILITDDKRQGDISWALNNMASVLLSPVHCAVKWKWTVLKLPVKQTEITIYVLRRIPFKDRAILAKIIY